MKKFQLWSLLAALAWLAGAACPVYGQGGFTLSITPSYTEVPLGNDLVLTLRAVEGVNLNAFDLTVVYDPEILILADWEFGDYFANLTPMTVSNQTGSLRVAATQVASSPVSGDGDVLMMTFNTKGQGYSFIDITRAEFADSAGNKLEPELVNGQVTVTLGPTYSPTVTSTPIRTATPIRTSTPTATPMPTLTRTPTRTSTVTGTPVQTEPLPSTGTLSPTSALTVTQTTALTGTAISLTASGTSLASTDTGSQTPSVTRSPWPVLDVTRTVTPVMLVITPTNDAGEPVPTPDRDDNSRNLLNGLLWGVLIAGVVILMILVVLILRRRNQKEEDLLL